MTILRSERIDFQIAPGYFLEFYKLPSGEKRVGKSSAAVSCGLKKNYFNRLQSATPKQLEALQSRGFTGYTVPVIIGRDDGRGASKSDTLSLDDFRAFIKFAAFDLGKKPAMAIAEAMLGIAIETIARQAFGEEALTIQELREEFCKRFAQTVNWMEEDRDDSLAIDEHLLFLGIQ
ncbi:MAG: hypothetical protein ACO3NK_09785 [Prochlorotrichaceae cyanobacterium]